MLTPWLDPHEIARDNRVLNAFSLVLCGVGAWDVLSTLSFDLSVVTHKRPWRWPMVLYFICRISMLLHVFSLAVNLNAISKIPCQDVIWISKVSDAVGTCGSSLILVLRTRAVWQHNVKVSLGLGGLFLGQVALWVPSCLPRWSTARWDPQRNLCAVVSTTPESLLIAISSYS